MNENLIARRKLLEGAIAEREPNLRHLQFEYNSFNTEINRLEFELNKNKKAAEKTQFYFTKMQVRQLEDQKQLDEVNRQISEIPTIARHEKTNPVFKDFAKAVVTVIFMLLTSFAFSQTFFSIEAGNRMGFNVGHTFKNHIMFKGGILNPYQLSTDRISHITYVAAGYEIPLTHEEDNNFTLTPMAGVAHYHVGDFSKWFAGGDPLEIDKTVLETSIELGKKFYTYKPGPDWNLYGSYYLFATHAQTFYYGIGIRAFIK